MTSPQKLCSECNEHPNLPDQGVCHVCYVKMLEAVEPMVREEEIRKRLEAVSGGPTVSTTIQKTREFRCFSGRGETVLARYHDAGAKANDWMNATASELRDQGLSVCGRYIDFVGTTAFADIRFLPTGWERP